MREGAQAAAERLKSFFAEGGEYPEGFDPEEDARLVADALSEVGR